MWLGSTCDCVDHSTTSFTILLIFLIFVHFIKFLGIRDGDLGGDWKGVSMTREQRIGQRKS